MNWCQKHWTQLRDAVVAKGLGDLIAKGGEALADKLAEPSPAASFEPLFTCWAAMNAALTRDLGGLYMGCTCCKLIEDGQPELVEDWINGATDEAREHAIALGLVKLQ